MVMMQNITEIQAVILAGGFGTRLKPLVSDRPKVLAEVSHRPFLTYILDQLSNVGIREVVLCTGFMAETIKKEFGQVYRNLRLLYSREERPLGTGGALRLAISYLWSDTILVLNGDSYMDVDLGAYVDWFFKKQGDAAIVLSEVPDMARYGRVVIDRDEQIITFHEKGLDEGHGLINAGIYLMKKSIVASIPAGNPYSLEREFFPSLIGKKLLGFRANGRFIDIGTPASYTAAEDFFASMGSRNKPVLGRVEELRG